MSLVVFFLSKNFNEEDFATALRKRQSASWALKWYVLLLFYCQMFCVKVEEYHFFHFHFLKSIIFYQERSVLNLTKPAFLSVFSSAPWASQVRC